MTFAVGEVKVSAREWWLGGLPVNLRPNSYTTYYALLLHKETTSIFTFYNVSQYDLVIRGGELGPDRTRRIVGSDPPPPPPARLPAKRVFSNPKQKSINSALDLFHKSKEEELHCLSVEAKLGLLRPLYH